MARHSPARPITKSGGVLATTHECARLNTQVLHSPCLVPLSQAVSEHLAPRLLQGRLGIGPRAGQLQARLLLGTQKGRRLPEDLQPPLRRDRSET